MMLQSPAVYSLISFVWLSFRNAERKLRDMTDIDFRRFASLLFALRLIGVADNPLSEGIKLADELLEELQQNE